MRSFKSLVFLLGLFIFGSNLRAQENPKFIPPEQRSALNAYEEYKPSSGFYFGFKLSTLAFLGYTYLERSGSYFNSFGGVLHHIGFSEAESLGNTSEALTRIAIHGLAIHSALTANAYMKGGLKIGMASTTETGRGVASYRRLNWGNRLLVSTATAYGVMHMAPHVLKTCAEIVQALASVASGA